MIGAALALCLAATSAPQGKQVTLLYTGDDGGEIAPCG